MTATFKFTKSQDGDWAITGPINEMRQAVETGAVVIIKKRSGSSQVRLTGEVFENDEEGIEGCVWQFEDIGPARATRTRKPALRRNSEVTRLHCVTGGNCSSITGRNCGAEDCDAN